MFSVYVKDSVGVALWHHLCVPQRCGHAGGGASEDPRCTAGGVPGARQEQSDSPLCLAPPPLPPSPGSDFLVLTSWFLTWRPVVCVCFQQQSAWWATCSHSSSFVQPKVLQAVWRTFSLHLMIYSLWPFFPKAVLWLDRRTRQWCIVGFAVSVLSLKSNPYLFVYLKGEILFRSRLLWSHGVGPFLAS